MNRHNNKFRSQGSVSSDSNTWGTFSSRKDRQPNYNKPGNTGGFNNNGDRQPNNKNFGNTGDGSNLQYQSPLQFSDGNDFNNQYQSNLEVSDGNDFNNQYQSNLEVSVGNGFNNPFKEGGGSFDANQSNFNDYGYSRVNNDDYQQNSNNFEYSRVNSDGFQQNSNNFEYSRVNSDEYQQNSNNYGSQQDQSNIDFFGSQQNQGNSNNFGSQQQNRFNSNNFGAKNRYQQNSNNMKNSKNSSGNWLSGAGQGSFSNGGNNNSNPQNQFNANGGGGDNGNNNNSNYVPFRKFREHFSNRPDNSSGDNTPAPSLFMGRDQSYPNELNDLMNPFFCGVCGCRLNSIKSANIHYESKAHDKQISNWMKKTFTEKGLEVPQVQRFVTEDTIGPYRCELCKVDLTSAQHALQHYNGKRHRQAASKVSPPTGIGYYNVDGQWVVTGKVIDKVTGKETSYILVNTPSGFEPVVLHVAPIPGAVVKRPAGVNKTDEQPAAKKTNLEKPEGVENEKDKNQNENSKQPQGAANSITSNQYKTVSLGSQESSNSGQSPQEALESLQCKICGIATTSYDQMLLHLKGTRHTKKLKGLGEPPISNLFDKAPTTILESLDRNSPSDVSMYRTPSGSYYCKTCNVGMEDVGRIKKHIASKAHFAAVKKGVEKPVKS